MSRTPPCHTNIRTGSLIPILITLTLGLGSGMEPRELAAQDSVVFDSSDVAGLTFRSIGPPRGGRSTAVAGITEKPLTYFLGGTGSGVWKTV